jgi:membrane-associated phospholipid phosphatase
MNTLIRPPSRSRQFVAARFSAEGAAGLHLTFGVMILVAAAWLFGAIAGQVAGNGPVTLVDVQLANWFHAHATPAITNAMLFITTWNSVAGVLLMSAILGCVLWRRGQRAWLLALVATVPGGDAVNVLMKLSFARARPSFLDPIVTLDTFSFPSGHAASAALFYGFLACLLMRHAAGFGQRAAIAVAAALMVALVGFSRIYLGAHYLTDVVAGAAEGLAWLAICITATSTLQRRRAARG